MPYRPPPDLASLSLAEIAELAEAQKLPPVDQWEPQETGDSEMRIAADGSWFHQGSPINRPGMVRAFSTILRREGDGSFALVTPYQKLSIEVEDTPFLAVEVESEGKDRDRRFAFRLNTDHLVIADADHMVQFGEREGQPHPVITVRSGLDARLTRPVYYRLAEWILAEDNEPPGLWSHGQYFALGPA